MSLPAARPAKRIRLPAEDRRTQILAAALHEFSEVGFKGATMDRIAQRTGLTKAGLYAHFDSKEQVLQSVMAEVLCAEVAPACWQWHEGVTLEALVDTYLDRLYDLVRMPSVQAAFRLLVTETARDPERMQRWNESIFEPHARRRQASMDECVAKGVVADNAFSRHVSLTSSPAIIALLGGGLVQADAHEHERARIREAHRCMLLSTLRPPQTPSQSIAAAPSCAPPPAHPSATGDRQ